MMMNLAKFWWNFRYDDGRYICGMYDLLRKESLLVPKRYINNTFMLLWTFKLISLSLKMNKIKLNWLWMKEYKNLEDIFPDDIRMIGALVYLFGIGMNILIIKIRPDFKGWKLLHQQTVLVRQFYDKSLVGDS